MDKNRSGELEPVQRSIRPPRSGETLRQETHQEQTETLLALRIDEPREDESPNPEPRVLPRRNKGGTKPGSIRGNYQRHKQYERTKPVADSEVGTGRITRVMNLAARGLTTEDIQKVTNLPISSINSIRCELAELLTELGKIEDYRAIRRDLLDATHIRLLKSINDPEKIAKANLYQLAYASESLYKQSRLEANLSTENRAVTFMSVNGDKYNHTR